MKKDVQDFLLPFVENGELIIIGLTTENPYRSINPAIRSRCHIYRMNEITKDDVIKLLEKTIIAEKYNEFMSNKKVMENMNMNKLRKNKTN